MRVRRLQLWQSGAVAESRHVSIWIERRGGEVYDYIVDTANLPNWASGIAFSVERVAGQWFVESPMGRAGFSFVDRNEYGVLDHQVTLASGESFLQPDAGDPGRRPV